MAKTIEAEVRQYAPKALTSTAHLLLLSLADSANHDDRMVWLSNATLVHDTRSCERSVQNAYKQLADLNIVTVVPEVDKVARAKGWKTIVRIIKPVSEWAQTYDRRTGSDTPREGTESPESGPPQDAESAPPQNLHPRRNCAEGGAESAPKPSTSNQEHKTKQTTSASLQPEGRRRTPIFSPPTTRRRKPSAADEDAERDPAALQDREDAPGPAAGGGQALELVYAFKHAMYSRPAAREQMRSPDAINWPAMTATFKRWLTSGTTPVQIRAMIDAYAAQEVFQRHNLAPWQDFLAARTRLYNAAARFGHQLAARDPGSAEALAYYGLTPEGVKPLESASNRPTLSELRRQAMEAIYAKRGRMTPDLETEPKAA